MKKLLVLAFVATFCSFTTSYAQWNSPRVAPESISAISNPQAWILANATPMPHFSDMQGNRVVQGTGYIIKSPVKRDRNGAIINPGNYISGIWILQHVQGTQNDVRPVQISAQIETIPSSWEYYENMDQPMPVTIKLETNEQRDYVTGQIIRNTLTFAFF